MRNPVSVGIQSKVFYNLFRVIFVKMAQLTP